ncbi:hypothetical protein BG005_004702 [Podila minutissima]|nr:hypothetical protein BG005_004702 [Podila minutissima]
MSTVPETHTSSQAKVLSIPELRDNITQYLAKKDIGVLTRTCRAWTELWTPDLYKRLGYTSVAQLIMPFPNMSTHGHLVEAVQTSRLQPAEIAELVQKLPNLRTLDLVCFKLSGAEMDKILEAIQGPLIHLRIVPFQSSVLKPGGSRYPDPIFLSVVSLRNLQSLEMNALGMTIHVDDVLYVLKMCPHLRSVILVFLNIVCQMSSGDGQEETETLDARGDFDPAGPVRFPMDSSDMEGLYVGRRLRRLKLNYCRILDHGLLRLLGIDVAPPATSDSHGDHCLVHLEVGINTSSRISDKSVTRILRECGRLEHLDLQDSKAATLALFREVRPWPCTATLQHLSLNLKAHQLSRRVDYFGPLSAANGIAVFSTEEEQMVYDQLSSLRQLRKLRLNVIMSFEMIVLQDMSFAKYLQSARIELMFQTTNKPGPEDKEMMTQKCEEWVKRQPQKWIYYPSRGNSFPMCTLMFEKNKIRRS